MSSDKRYVLSKVPASGGLALDLGGGSGALRRPLEQRGYRYVNLDLKPAGSYAVTGDAALLPFGDARFDLVVSSDSLEHFPRPLEALEEVARVLKPTGRLVLWVPFLHPFHGDDLYRYTPLALRDLLGRARLEVDTLEAPLGPVWILGQMVSVALRRLGLGRLERVVEGIAARVDSVTARFLRTGLGFAAAYLVVARPAASTVGDEADGGRG